jgi:hypothetical protein
MKIHFFVIVLALFSHSSFCFSQTNIEKIELGWKDPESLIVGVDETRIVPSFEHRMMQGNSPWIVRNVKVKARTYYNVTNVVSEPATDFDRKYILATSIKLENNFSIVAVSKKAGNDIYQSIEAFPYAIIDGEVRRLVSITIETGGLISQSVAKSFTYLANSVLGSGDWYKISVAQSGIFKIDREFLISLGIASTVNPQHINVYGNGFGVLPEQNSIARPDDLLKLSIQAFGESDGVLDVGDFFLFYADGPNHVKYQAGYGLTPVQNIYNDKSFYYINVNPLALAKRIQSASESILPVTTTIGSFDDFSYHELDSKNLIRGGQRFYGELFDTQLSYDFLLATPNIISTDVIKCKFSSAGNGSGSATMNVKSNGALVGSYSLTSAASEYSRSEKSFNFLSSGSSQIMNLEFVRSNAGMISYLDRLEIAYRRNLLHDNGQMIFSDNNSVGTLNIGKFQIQNMSSDKLVWEITKNHEPAIVNGVLTATVYEFVVACDTLRKFIVHDGAYFTPLAIGSVSVQDLHGLAFADYLIVTHPLFLNQANRLAQLHRDLNGLTVHVVTTDQVYNEFSSGSVDPTAIKWFAKMFRDRAISAGTPALAPKFVCLFGDGTYDPKNRVSGNNYMVPTYEFLASEDLINAMVVDDYFGMLDDTEAINPSDLLDIGIGRILATTEQQATEQVDKIENYIKNGIPSFADENGNYKTFGDWRLHYNCISDDADISVDNQFFSDCESLYTQVKSEHPEVLVSKAYLDAYQQESGAGGQRYPDVNDWINSEMEKGSLVMNYLGHGGEVQLARESVVNIPAINSWKNNKMGLFVSATCEFCRFDDPSRLSAGEQVSLNPVGGAIALMTTTRSVYFSTNADINMQFVSHAFDLDAAGNPLHFGDIVMRTKNTSSASNNKRAFTLIGDPALRIALPINKIKIDSINGYNPNLYLDTLRALSFVEIKGHVEDLGSALMSGFNGVATVIMYDKTAQKLTLGQDAGTVNSFEVHGNQLFKGKVSVVNGLFYAKFVVPKDINYAYGKGKLVVYAENGLTDAAGVNEKFYIGGIDPNGIVDNLPPIIDGYFNDVLFAEQGLTSENPSLQIKFTDDFGINAVGNGIGHDITAVLDGNVSEPINLNDYYETDLDTYKTGTVKFQMKNIAVGKHTLTIKAWDVNNNSGEDVISFEVAAEKELVLAHVLNYPNPFTTATQFFFEHNQACNQSKVQIQIFTISGKLAKTINTEIGLNGFRSEGIAWDGTDDYGDVLAKGVYIYNLKVVSCDGKTAEKTEKLVLLR